MIPKFVVVAVMVALASLVLGLVVAWQLVRLSDAETKRDCERAVSYREDNRAMWLYLVDTNKSADQARVDAFVAELNKRLPQLDCRDGNTIPIS